MKKIILSVLFLLTFACFVLTGCELVDPGLTSDFSTASSESTQESQSVQESGSEASSSGGLHMHLYSGKITVMPTCTEEGEMTYTCECGHSYTEALVAVGHNYKSTIVKEPTCTEEGEKKYTCFNCRDSYTEAIAAIGHNFEDGECTHCGMVNEVVKIKVSFTQRDVIYTSYSPEDVVHSGSITVEAVYTDGTKTPLTEDDYTVECDLSEVTGEEGEKVRATATVYYGEFLAKFKFNVTIRSESLGKEYDVLLAQTEAAGINYYVSAKDDTLFYGVTSTATVCYYVKNNMAEIDKGFIYFAQLGGYYNYTYYAELYVAVNGEEAFTPESYQQMFRLTNCLNSDTLDYLGYEEETFKFAVLSDDVLQMLRYFVNDKVAFDDAEIWITPADYVQLRFMLKSNDEIVTSGYFYSYGEVPQNSGWRGIVYGGQLYGCSAKECLAPVADKNRFFADVAYTD